MAADLPDFRATSSLHMARVLTSYIDCPYTVQSRIREDFDQPPAIQTIKRMRAEFLAGKQPKPEEPHKAHEGYYPDDVAKTLDWANQRFVKALEKERALSAMKALRSDFLTRPELVDRRWEIEAAAARSRNTEGMEG